MDYTAIAATFTFAGIQFVISWNFHRIYLKLYNDFKEVVDKIGQARQKKLQEGLGSIVSLIQMSQKEGDLASATAQYLSSRTKPEEINSQITYLVEQAKEPKDLYSKTRESTEKAYKYFAISGLTTLLGVVYPITLSEIAALVYLGLIVALVYAVNAWFDFDQNMKKLVVLRDKGE